MRGGLIIKLCPACGSYNDESSDYCVFCQNELFDSEYFQPLYQPHPPQTPEDTIDERRWSHPPSPYPPSKKPRKWIIPIVLIVVVIIIVAIAAMFLIGVFKPLKIISVTHKPENPQPGDWVTIRVVAEGCSGCDINSHSYFGTGPTPCGTMENVGAETYEYEIGPFDEGTEVWYMVSATSYGGSFVVSDSFIIQIGEIERSNITTISISNVHQFPEKPTTKGDVVTVSADITSNKSLIDIWFGEMFFYPNGCGGGGGMMFYESGNTFTGKIYVGDSDKGTKFFYKIAAQDESGNTVVLETVSFTLT